MRPHLAVLALALACAAPLAAQNDSTRPLPPRSDTLKTPPPGARPPLPDTTPIPLPPRVIPESGKAPPPASALAPAEPPAPAAPASNLYLPMASWVTPYVEYLIRAGVLQGLDPLTRPLRRADVARAVAKVDTTDLAESVKGTLRLVAWEVEERPDTVRWKLDGGLGFLGASDASRWTDRPAAGKSRVYPQGDLAFSIEMPHLALITHPYFDNRLKYDPEYIGKKDRFVAGRSDENYLIGSWKYFDVFFGAASRNWGPPEVQGLILSNAPYAYDHLFLRLGPQRLRLEMVATQLNDLYPWGNTTQPARRFLSVHRLVVTPSDRFAFSLSEAMLYADANAVSRSFEPWYLNPLNLWILEQYQSKPTGNTLLGADFSWLLRRPALRLAAQLYADDIQVDRVTQHDKKPEELGYTFNLTGGAFGGAASWSAFYTRVDALDYRTASNQEQYSIDSVGLARNHSDYDQYTLKVETAPQPQLLVGGELTFLRQGQGDFRIQYPPDSAFSDTLVLLTGIVERTLRLAVQANWTPVPGVNLSTDVGRHFIWNANHVRGVRGDRWVWRVKAEIRRRITGGIHPDR